MTTETSMIQALEAVLGLHKHAAIAVSGGVDSMTLAVVAGRMRGSDTAIYHATSPAVPAEATARVRHFAQRENWQLTVLDAGEFDDPDYRANPANRCYYCKSNLYQAIAAHTDAQLLSGTNLDDLGDWRPGLKSAEEQNVRHPFVEAEIDKAGIRRIADALAPLISDSYQEHKDLAQGTEAEEYIKANDYIYLYKDGENQIGRAHV